MSDSVRLHRWQPTRLPRPWDSPGKNTGVGCHFLLQCMKVKVKVKSLSRVRLLVTPWTAAHQPPPSVGFSRQECWSGVPSPSPDKLCRIYKLYVDDYDSSNRSLFNLNYLEYLPCFPFLSLCCSHEALDMNSLLHLNLLLFSSAYWKESKVGDI